MCISLLPVTAMSKQPEKRKRSPAEDEPGPRKRQAVVLNPLQMGNTTTPRATTSTSSALPLDPPISPAFSKINISDVIPFKAGTMVAFNTSCYSQHKSLSYTINCHT